MHPMEYKGQEESQLFLIRLWAEADNGDNEGSAGNDGTDAGAQGGGRTEWCGKVQHVVSGEAEYFRGWPTLIEMLLKMAEKDRI